jgi:hypothetical protein
VQQRLGKLEQMLGADIKATTAADDVQQQLYDRVARSHPGDTVQVGVSASVRMQSDVCTHLQTQCEVGTSLAQASALTPFAVTTTLSRILQVRVVIGVA